MNPEIASETPSYGDGMRNKENQTAWNCRSRLSEGLEKHGASWLPNSVLFLLRPRKKSHGFLMKKLPIYYENYPFLIHMNMINQFLDG